MNFAKGFSLILAGGLILTACQNAPDKPQRWSNSNLDNVDFAQSAQNGFDLNNLDTSAVPTENFFQFANGGWIDSHPVPSTESRWGTFDMLRDENQKRIKNIISDITSAETQFEKGSEKQLIADLYHSAMAVERIEKEGYNDVLKVYKEIDALSNVQDMIKLYADFSRSGIGKPFSYYVYIDKKNSSEYISYMGQSGLTLPDKDYYTVDKKRFTDIKEAYRTHLTNMYVLEGHKEGKAAQLADRILAVETKMAEVSMSRVERRDPEKTYNKMSYQETLERYPNLYLEQYFAAMGVTFDDIIISQPAYLDALNEMMTSVSLDDWKLYSKWKVLTGSASWLGEQMVKENFHFKSTVLRGVKEMRPRDERASRLINSVLGEPLGKIYVEQHFPKESKERIEGMIENLRAVYKERVNALDWMSDSTKMMANAKLDAFTYKIGYPDKWEDYSKVDITPESILSNLRNLNKFNTELMLAKLGKEVDKTEWGMSPQTVNAYYNPVFNEVVFPAGILQPPFFDPNADDAINYGAIGGVIGHEFTHGFDDSGARYDANGNLKNWWTPKDLLRFKKRADVVVNQFNDYEPLESVNVNGKLTLGENIADLGGMTLSFHAMQKQFEEQGRPADVDGFTPEQRFFLGWAQVWAQNATPEFVKNQVTTDPHSPAKYRVNGPMSNMQEFRDTWMATADEAMVRTDSLQAKIW